MADTPDPADLPLEADLGLVTHAEWLEGHAALTDLLADTGFPAEELTFIWDADLDPQTLISPTEVDYGPA